MMLHAKHAFERGTKQVTINSPGDTDGLVIGLYHLRRFNLGANYLSNCGYEVEYKKRFVPLHGIDLSDDLIESFPGFNVITGCDTVSSFCGKGKKTFFKRKQNHALLRGIWKQLGCW